MKLLVIEDEPKVAAFLKQGLEENNYDVDVAYDGMLGARLALSNNYDVIIMDLILPLLNGLELCKKLREQNNQVPILMLTALGTTDDKVKGFDAGVDDYLVKPFEFVELLARVRALSKRSGKVQTSTTIKIGDLELDINKKTAKRNELHINLTAKEFKLLEFLMNNAGRVVSRSEIAEKVWDIRFDTGTNVVDVYINLLRKKINDKESDKLIHTRVGLGYVLQVD